MGFSAADILVTGGGGFLGSHVVRELLALDNEVIVLDDLSNGKDWHLRGLDGPLTLIEGDITNEDDVSRAIKGADIIIHLAVLGLRESIKHPKRVNQVIVDGTIMCLDEAVKNNVELFLNCSPSEVFGSAVYVPWMRRIPSCPRRRTPRPRWPRTCTFAPTARRTVWCGRPCVRSICTDPIRTGRANAAK